ncbi:MAG: AGE family epimerase/isomerase [Muribaculaceae bacterium]|nr:AGE family epimerase/isomerase [Muribaculaceae bacterium]
MKERLRQEMLDELQKNILPYWMERMTDPRGGFYGRRDGDDVLDADAVKGAILNARILWTFSAAYRVLGRPEYLETATRAKREIIDKFYDPEYGGIYWSINADGTPHDTRKQFYAIGFAIYGLSEYVRATGGDEEALDYAVRLFRDIEHHSRDRVRGGYLEATNRDWSAIEDMRLSDKDDNAAKTMNTHLHIIEPYTNLLRVWPDDELKEATGTLLRLFLDTFMVEGGRGHLGLFFDKNWRRCDGRISYGHDIEASWLMLETAQVLGDADLLQRTLEATRRVADAAIEGRCWDGSMIYERHADGRYDDDKHWWVQAENVVGQVYQYLFHGRKEFLPMAAQSWDYIRDNIVDTEKGEWLWSRRGTEANREDDKAGFWKCPYHNSRMCLEVAERLG